jgi:hypothetical protein
MANRRTHLRAVKTEEKSKEDYKDKIRRHKMTAVYRFVFVILKLTLTNTKQDL